MEKPGSVQLGTTLLWIGWISGVILTQLLLGTFSLFLGISLLGIGVLIGYLVPTFFIYMISGGRNWARITYLVICISSLLGSGGLAVAVLRDFPLFALATLGARACEVAGLALLFTPSSNEWFREAKALPELPRPSAAVPITLVALLFVAGGLITLTGHMKERGRIGMLQARCKDAGTKFLAKPIAPVRSVAHDWDPGWVHGPTHPIYELEDKVRVRTISGMGAASPRGLEFTEYRTTPRESRVPRAVTLIRVFGDRKYEAAESFRADILVFHEVSDRYAIDQGPVRYTLTVSDRRGGQTLAKMVYWIDEKNKLGCGANNGNSIDEVAFIQQAIAR